MVISKNPPEQLIAARKGSPLVVGIGKDEFVFDLRLTFGMNKLGDSGVRDAVKLRSLIFSIGAKL